MAALNRKALAGLVALAAIAAFLLWRDGDERRIRRQVVELQKLVSKTPAEGDLEGLRRARQITELFADRFEVVAEAYGFRARDRRSLAGGVAGYRSRSSAIAMRVYDEELRIDAGSRRATLTMTADFVTGLDDLAGREAYRLQLDWIEERGEWRIEYARLLEVLEAPQALF